MGNVKLACQNGDKVTHTFYAVNEGTATCFDTVGTFIVPEGLSINLRTSLTSSGGVTPVLSAGVYNSTQKKWIIGSLRGGNRETITVEFEVTDEGSFGANDFVVEFTLSSSCVEDVSDNSTYLIIEKYCPTEAPESCEDLNITLV